MKQPVASHLSCSLALPAGFRIADILSFQSRDAQAVAEKVDGGSFQKGLSWEGQAARLSIRFANRNANVELAVDGTTDGTTTGSKTALEQMARRLLGLRQPIEAFEHQYRTHPLLGPLIARNPGLRVPQTATPFEALTWAITGQQISVNAAISVRRKFIQAAGLRHSSDLWCYPDARRVASLTTDGLRQAGLSHTKARTISELSQRIEQNLLPLDTWMNTPLITGMTAEMAADIHAQLMLIRGIGPWTISYTLLRGFGHLDGSLQGDVAVRRKMQALLGVDEHISEQFAARWLAEFSPWRALVAAHLWASP
ncbi:MAG: DNA-3-methyladenine glycosylase 2 [Porticoccaceae bacterium]